MVEPTRREEEAMWEGREPGTIVAESPEKGGGDSGVELESIESMKMPLKEGLPTMQTADPVAPTQGESDGPGATVSEEVGAVQLELLEAQWGPETLRREGLVYDLYAAVHHTGSLHGGHYTSHAKVDGKWHYLNDASVTVAPPQALQSNSAYILFYLRRDMDPKTVSLADIYPPCQPATVDVEDLRKKKWLPPVRHVTTPARLRRKSVQGDCTPGGCAIA